MYGAGYKSYKMPRRKGTQLFFLKVLQLLIWAEQLCNCSSLRLIRVTPIIMSTNNISPSNQKI